MVREARPEELPSIGALRVEAYERGGFLRPDDPYAGTLRALGRQRDGTVLVAEDSGRLLGTIMLAAGAGTELAGTAGAADIRALAVAPGSQGRGIGRRLAARRFGLFRLPTGANRIAWQHSPKGLNNQPIPNRRGVLHFASELRPPCSQEVSGRILIRSLAFICRAFCCVRT